MDIFATQDQYVEAVERITSEINAKPEEHDKAELFLLRAQNLLKLEKFKEANSDASRALELGASAEAYLVQGKALFSLGCLLDSLEAFRKGKDQGGVGKLDQFGQWITWCEERIKKLGITDTKDTPAETSMDGTKGDTDGGAATPTTLPSAEPSSVMPVPKIKHDWYQTEAFVIITVLVKNLKKDDVKINFSEKTVSVSAPLPSGSEYSLELDLCHPINPEESLFRVVPSKIEIKLKKVDSTRWLTLEGDGEPPSAKASLTGVTESTKATAYPSSAPKKHDWNKLEAQVKKEEEEEKLEGDAALNQLFQKIYGQGSEETRRAMNKSYMESGGTVLSTNWKEVSDKKVDIKPPDGMEWKNWKE